MKERIQKVLASAGVASRRNIEEMVRQGRIAVNGKTMIDLPILVDPKRDKVTVDEEPVRLASKDTSERIYLIMNKPKGVYTTNVAQGVQTRAIDLLPPKFPRVYPVGQLDAESKGLLILTNDGELTNLLTHPRYGVPKTYRAVVDGFIKPQDVQELEKGVWMADKTGKGFKTGRSHIKIATRTRDKSVLEITIREGRNRQIRRMLARIGHKVRDITRTRMGPLTLHGLAVGEFRPLTFRELRELRQAGRPQDARTRKVPGAKPDAQSEADDE
jgi:23S rRNA pseudouridine2605 synthase